MEHKLTDKKLKDKRYRRTEAAIIRAFSLVQDKFNAQRIIKTAKISRSTLYRHHGTVYRIALNYEEYINNKYRRLSKKLIRKKLNPRFIYQRTLVFIMVNQQIVKFVMDYNNSGIIEKMLINLSPLVTSSGRIKNKTILDICIKEMTALVEEWFSDGCDKNSIITVADKLAQLVGTANSRLIDIVKPE